VTSFGLSDKRYGLNQLRYDLRKMRAHALLEHDGNRYAYRLTDKGVKVALLFVLFHQRLYGPLANSLFHHRPDANFQPDSKLEKPCTKQTTPYARSFNSWKRREIVVQLLSTIWLCTTQAVSKRMALRLG
jgi:hypothetical protein